MAPKGQELRSPDTTRALENADISLWRLLSTVKHATVQMPCESATSRRATKRARIIVAVRVLAISKYNLC